MRYTEFKTLLSELDQSTKDSSTDYTVVSGDNLSKIANNQGVKLADLIAANKQIKNPDRIYPGDVIKIPGSSVSKPAPETPEIERNRPTMKDDPRVIKPNNPKKKQSFSRYEIANTESAGECFDFFKGKGLNDIQCSAFVGNFYTESKLNTKAHNQAENARGIVQWRLDRLKGLADFAKKVKKNWHSLQLQLDYTWHELTGTKRITLSELDKNKNNLEQCVKIVMNKYEIADPKSYPERLGYAESAMRLFGMEPGNK
jgi:murein DD-endopeptidase MepM/ murein hydrolase activator NlpD